MNDQPIFPDYSSNVRAIVPALVAPQSSGRQWMPEPVRDSEQVVILVLDGLGWEQLQERRDLMPNLTSFAGGAVTTVFSPPLPALSRPR